MTDSQKPKLIPVFTATDDRGSFEKPYSYGYGEVPFVIRELFWTVSRRGTVRGMHVQLPPTPSQKLVWVSSGTVVDVVVDLRKGKTFGRVQAFELNTSKGEALLIPTGFGHGFQALEDETVVNYATDCEFDPQTDSGVNVNSIGFDWPLPMSSHSSRDASLPDIDRFVSPF